MTWTSRPVKAAARRDRHQRRARPRGWFALSTAVPDDSSAAPHAPVAPAVTAIYPAQAAASPPTASRAAVARPGVRRSSATKRWTMAGLRSMWTFASGASAMIACITGVDHVRPG
jgi:hypothetical protein